MEHLRRTAVAGSWYPRDRGALTRELEHYIDDVDVDPLPSPPLALIAPHAGLMYSGPVAAFAYKTVREGHYDAVVLVGPSHFVPFSGVSIWSHGAWETPFGSLSVDAELAAAIRAASPAIVEVPEAHGREHSLEMQLPFIAYLLPSTRIVPLVMGRQTRATAHSLGNAIAETIGANTLIVASSDLSHYEDAHTAAAMDEVVLDHVEALDDEGLMQTLERNPRHACGGGPMVAVLRAARQRGARQSRVLKYGDSGDISGDKSSVVGYMAAAIW